MTYLQAFVRASEEALVHDTVALCIRTAASATAGAAAGTGTASAAGAAAGAAYTAAVVHLAAGRG